MTRLRVVQSEPDPARDLSGFPAYRAPVGRRWHRQHQRRLGPWWFSSGPGRFDLPEPEGSCYLADSALAAVRELVGPDHLGDAWVERELVADRVVSAVPLPHPVRAANVSVATAARYGISAELTAMVPYAVPQAWARALRATGFEGVRYQLRFSPGGAHHALAVFGPAGAPDPPWPSDPDPTPVETLAAELGLEVVDPPSFGAVTVVEPPA